jgi:hypothetical protein
MTATPSDSSPPFNPYFALISGVLAVSTGAIFARLADAPALAIENIQSCDVSFQIDNMALIIYPISAKIIIKRLQGGNTWLTRTLSMKLARGLRQLRLTVQKH